MAIESGDFKTGLTLIVDGDPWVVLDFMHVKPGKGAAILQTKMKNLKTGATQERNFNASTKFDAATIERKSAQYSYSADDTYYFMDMETYEQLGISIVVPIVSSLLTYLAAIKKSKNDVEAVKISAETEIKKIREESDKELKKFKKKQMSKLD